MKKVYPKTHQEFLDWFRTERTYWKYLYQLRWPDGFCCPLCQNPKAWHNDRNLLRCTKCKHETSITAGSIFHGTRKPLKLWFYVIWLVMAQKTGSSAQNLKEAMGFGSYETSWSWLHKLRRAMIRPGRHKSFPPHSNRCASCFRFPVQNIGILRDEFRFQGLGRKNGFRRITDSARGLEPVPGI